MVVAGENNRERRTVLSSFLEREQPSRGALSWTIIPTVMRHFKREAKRLTGVDLSDSHLQAFERYHALLVEWNKRFNLTALTTREEIYRKHFLDSLSCIQAFAALPPEHVVDVGAGAGFPGLPLKILRPNMELTLIESNQKKAGFLEKVAAELQLDGVEIVPQRAEQAGKNAGLRERFDWAVARAVAPLPVLVEYMLPLVRVGGFVLAQKGSKAQKEAESAEIGLEMLGGRLKEIIPVEIEGIEEKRNLVVIEKIASTPEKYPRKSGIPQKRPLV